VRAAADTTVHLSEWAASARFRDVPEYQNVILNAWVDTVGVTLAGYRVEELAPVRSFAREAGLGAPGEAQCWGDGAAVSPAGAALLNGTAGHVMDYDDVHPIVHGHPSTVLFPGLVAAAQHVDASPERLFDGYVAGLGVMTAMGVMFGPDHYTHGWHSTGTCGAIGTAAGIAVMLDMEPAEVRKVMSAAASMASGLRANFGTTLKPLHAGLAARSAVEAALLVRAGASAHPSAIEGALGAVAVFGDGSWPGGFTDPVNAALSAARRSPEQLGLKLYPSCLGTHYAIDAALDVRKQLRGEAIERITVRIPRGARTALLYDDPTSGLESKFSLPFAVSVALAHGLPGPGRFTDRGVGDPATRELMARLTVAEDAEGGDAAAAMDRRYAEVEAQGVHGSRALSRVTSPRGSAGAPASSADVDAKFLACAEGLGESGARDLLQILRHPLQLQTLRGLFPVSGGERIP